MRRRRSMRFVSQFGDLSAIKLEPRSLAAPMFVRITDFTGQLYQASAAGFVSSDTPPIGMDESVSSPATQPQAASYWHGTGQGIDQIVTGFVQNVAIVPDISSPSQPVGIFGIQVLVDHQNTETGQSFGAAGVLEELTYASGNDAFQMVDYNNVPLTGTVHVEFQISVNLGGPRSLAYFEVHFQSPFLTIDALGGFIPGGGADTGLTVTDGNGNTIEDNSSFASSGVDTAYIAFDAPVAGNVNLQYQSTLWAQYFGPPGEPEVSGHDEQTLDWSVHITVNT